MAAKTNRPDLEIRIEYLNCIKQMLDWINDQTEYDLSEYESYKNHIEEAKEGENTNYYETRMIYLERRNKIWSQITSDILEKLT